MYVIGINLKYWSSRLLYKRKTSSFRWVRLFSCSISENFYGYFRIFFSLLFFSFNIENGYFSLEIIKSMPSYSKRGEIVIWKLTSLCLEKAVCRLLCYIMHRWGSARSRHSAFWMRRVTNEQSISQMNVNGQRAFAGYDQFCWKVENAKIFQAMLLW